MTTRMLIDARHREETRVAVIKGTRIEEFDFESAEHKQIKGNIYLAKVTRVEPSLQAAFVEYGGNRHGFLAFSEIHPDYYQIPKEDREALFREEAEYAAAEAAMRAEEEIESLEGEVEDVQPPEPLDDDADDDDDHNDDSGDDEDSDGEEGQSEGEEGQEDGGRNDRGRDGRNRGGRRRPGSGKGRNDRSDKDEVTDFRRSLHRRYKIQDVIRRRQVLLVQVVKEERGTKGAALTSYLSLAGRYCVLMPNSSHGGGISRKISNGADRKRLKSVIDELGLPTTMGCIVRTAGLERTKTEIKRDFDYLARLWDEIREKTLKSEAPALIHSDSDLIKRAIRDIYNGDISDVAVEGDEGYRAAKDFMKLLMPSHARRVQQYSDSVPLFQRYGVEDQLGAMYQPVVSLKSGGYLVINPTEALVSIDINSGRSTREHNIEQTALNTNLEAAYEIARQLRLRDMAGLVVIDFIDMEVGNHVRKVERAMRDALKNDRARIQVGRISGFGLMEMSRQRLRTGVLEASTRQCPHCEGTGLVRTASSAGLSALRLLEEEAARGRGSKLVLRASQEATIYVLNNKRAELSEIEARYGVTIEVIPDGHTEGARMAVEAAGPPPANIPRLAPIISHDDEDDDDDVTAMIDDEDDDEVRDETRDDNGRSGREEGDRSKRSRGRRRRRGRDGNRDDQQIDRTSDEADDSNEANEVSETSDGEVVDGAVPAGDTEEAGRRRRRGRRGGRGRRNDGEGRKNEEGDLAVVAEEAGDTATPLAVDIASPYDAISTTPASTDGDAEVAKPKRAGRSRKATAAAEVVAPVQAAEVGEAQAVAVEEAAPVAKAKRASRARKTEPAGEDSADAPVAAPVESPAAPVVKAKPASRSRKTASGSGKAKDSASADNQLAIADSPADDQPSGERRSGWWQRTFGT